MHNKYLTRIKPYSVASHVIWEVPDSEKKSILKLDWNEATIPPSPLVKQRIISSINSSDYFNLYPNTHNQNLIDRIAEYAGVDSGSVQIFVGSDLAHEHIVRSYISPKDKVLIIGPTYDNFRLTVETQGGDVFYFNFIEDNDFDLIKFLSFSKDLNPKLIYICNPNNPTGRVIDNAMIEEILKAHQNSVVLVDEAYYEFYKISMKDYIIKYDNLIITRTFSKAFALANLRVGYILSNEYNIDNISKIRNSKSISTIAQIAIIAVLDDIVYTMSYVDEVVESRSYFKDKISKLKYVEKVYESYGNFLLLKFSDAQIKLKLYEKLAENNIFVRDLKHDPVLENTLRFTIGLKNQMDKVLGVLESTLI